MSYIILLPLVRALIYLRDLLFLILFVLCVSQVNCRHSPSTLPPLPPPHQLLLGEGRWRGGEGEELEEELELEGELMEVQNISS